MKFVVDASVALKWAVDEPGADEAYALLAEDLIAPDLIWLECASGLWRRIVKGELLPLEALRKLDGLLKSPVKITRGAGDYEAALRIAAELAHPIYDCLYLACALREDCELVTADRRFLDALKPHPDLAARARILGGDPPAAYRPA